MKNPATALSAAPDHGICGVPGALVTQHDPMPELLTQLPQSDQLLWSRSGNFAELRSFFTRADAPLARQTVLIGDDYIKLEALPDKGRGCVEFVTVSDNFFVVISQLDTTDAAFHYRGENWIRIGFNLSGAQVLMFDGRPAGEIGPYTSHLMLHPQGIVHTDRYFARAQARWVSILCRREHWMEMLGCDVAALAPQLQRFLADGEPATYLAQRPLTRAMCACVSQFFHSAPSPTLRRLYLKAKAYEAFYTFLADCAAALPQRAAPVGLKRRDVERLHDARAILEREPGAAIALALLARRVGLNRNKLSHGFHRLFGTTILEFSRMCRLSTAHRLLCETDLAVQEVARRCGYRHASSFSAAFRAQFHLSPSSARRRRAAATP